MEITVDAFVSAEFLAERYGVKKRTIMRMLDAGRIPPAFRFGRRATRWRIADVLEWEKQQSESFNAGVKRRESVVGHGRLAANQQRVSVLEAQTN